MDATQRHYILNLTITFLLLKTFDKSIKIDLISIVHQWLMKFWIKQGENFDWVLIRLLAPKLKKKKLHTYREKFVGWSCRNLIRNISAQATNLRTSCCSKVRWICVILLNDCLEKNWHVFRAETGNGARSLTPLADAPTDFLISPLNFIVFVHFVSFDGVSHTVLCIVLLQFKKEDKTRGSNTFSFSLLDFHISILRKWSRKKCPLPLCLWLFRWPAFRWHTHGTSTRSRDIIFTRTSSKPTESVHNVPLRSGIYPHFNWWQFNYFRLKPSTPYHIILPLYNDKTRRNKLKFDMAKDSRSMNLIKIQ